VVAAKERDRRDLAGPLGRALARGLDALRDPEQALVLVPAPSRRAAARRRGGDPVARAAKIAAGYLVDCQAVSALRMHGAARDSLGLGPAARRANLRGRIRTPSSPLLPVLLVPNTEVVLVDDVLTTGATADESVRVLGAAGVTVRAVMVTCAA
jgi:predicted amidophosphoribosyltransferase